jgi:hypothetical protein
VERLISIKKNKLAYKVHSEHELNHHRKGIVDGRVWTKGKVEKNEAFLKETSKVITSKWQLQSEKPERDNQCLVASNTM